MPLRILTSAAWGFQFHDILVNPLIKTVLVGAKWRLVMILSFRLPNDHDVAPFFTCLLAICVSFLEKCLFKEFTHLKIVLSFYCWVTMVFYLYGFLDTSLLLDVWFSNIFPILWVVVSVSWWCSSKHKSFKYRWSPICLFFLLVHMTLVSHLRNYCLIQGHEGLLLCFFLGGLWF